MQLTQSSVGRKIIMAVTGIVLVSFVCVHLLGNSSMFIGADAINAYAQKLHSLGPFVWVFRLVMLAAFAIHIVFGIQLTLENKAATPESNVQVKRLKTGFGAETMIISGADPLLLRRLSPAALHRSSDQPRDLYSAR